MNINMNNINQTQPKITAKENYWKSQHDKNNFNIVSNSRVYQKNQLGYEGIKF